MISVLIGCGLRRAEAASLKLEDIQVREGHWVIADLNGKGGHIRTVPMPGCPKVIWSIVKEGAVGCGLTGLAPHDLRRTCARLCHQAGGELEQIQFLLGHVSIETTERYLGCKQRFQNAVNDAIGLDPNGS